MIGFCEKWWMTALRGAVALVFGLTVLVWPDPDDAVLAVAFGVFALVDGLVLGAVAVVGRDVLEQWWIALVEGVVGMVVGLVALTWPGIGGLGLLSLLAAWAVLTGVFEIETAVRLRRLTGSDAWLFLAGGLSLLVGIALIAVPKDDPLEIAWAIGVFGVAFGGVLLVAAGRLRRLARAARPSAPRQA
ncbi:MAG: DUF308 domain-containing protein [Actinobacteria bacterium]|nr:DUF308 domain-containing protein [Actinomycetota bacterium]